jgi:putative CocE/NonD family hydrolase
MRLRKEMVAAVAGLLLFALSAPIQAAKPNEQKPEPAKEVELTWGVRIPLRDGVHLNATVYKPKPLEGPLPVIFTLTPYISDSYHDRAYYFAQHGYIFVLVDARGRGNSEGEFEPFVNEGPDGHDVVEWLAGQRWSNGKVTMWGGSYAGFDQWVTLKEFPPHLATIVPAASAHAAVDFPFVNNILYPYEIQWQTLTSGVTPNNNLFGEPSFWISKFRELYLSHRPFKELDQVTGNLSTVFQEWVAHPTPDAYWDTMRLTPDEYRRINLPILSITSHYDGDQRGALHYYRQHMEHGSPEGKSRHYLIIGPWDHAGTRTPKAEVGGLKFGPASLLDMNKLHKEWYDWTLKDGAKPEFLKKQVAYYVMGAEEWKYADSLEAIATKKQTFYLHSDGKANDVFHSGSLREERPSASEPDRYVYDPLDVRPAELEKEDVENYLTDERYALNLFGNGLVYHTEPFAQETEISGLVRLVVWIAMDVPDTDFEVMLYEIQVDGTSIALTEDRQRARYRSSLREAKLVTPGEINRYEFNHFQFFSRRISKGSRLRLVFKSPNSIYWQKNYNSGGVVAEESGADARTAHVTLYHDAEHASFLELPVVK